MSRVTDVILKELYPKVDKSMKSNLNQWKKLMSNFFQDRADTRLLPRIIPPLATGCCYTCGAILQDCRLIYLCCTKISFEKDYEDYLPAQGVRL